ncbi:MAG TPA: twin transmembrane helix small protein [Dongiaceae bacterium]|jgi:hypothetical protein
MDRTLVTFIIFAGICTIAVLFLGLFSMAKGGEFNRKYGNLLMRLRVSLQAITVLLVIIVLYLASR